MTNGIKVDKIDKEVVTCEVCSPQRDKIIFVKNPKNPYCPKCLRKLLT